VRVAKLKVRSRAGLTGTDSLAQDLGLAKRGPSWPLGKPGVGEPLVGFLRRKNQNTHFRTSLTAAVERL
jgi:hypothetical protein